MSIGTQIDFNDSLLLSWNAIHSQSNIGYRSLSKGENGNAIGGSIAIDPTDSSGRYFARNLCLNNLTTNYGRIRIPVSTIKHGDSTSTSTQDGILVEFGLILESFSGGTIPDLTGGQINAAYLMASDGSTELMQFSVNSSGQWQITVDSTDYADTSGTTNPYQELLYRISLYYQSNASGSGEAAVWINGQYKSDLRVASHSLTDEVGYIDLQLDLSTLLTGTGWSAGTIMSAYYKYVAMIPVSDYTLIDDYNTAVLDIISSSGYLHPIFLDYAYLATNGDVTKSSFSVNVVAPPSWYNTGWLASSMKCRLDYRKKGDSVWTHAETVDIVSADGYAAGLKATSLDDDTEYEWRTRFHVSGTYDAGDSSTYFDPGFVGETQTLSSTSKTYRIMYVNCEDQSGEGGAKRSYAYALDRNADMCFHMGDKIYGTGDLEGFGPATTRSEFRIATRSALEDRWFCQFARKKPVFYTFSDEDFGEENWRSTSRKGYDPLTGLSSASWDGTARANASAHLPGVSKGTLYDAGREEWYHHFGTRLLGSHIDFGSNKDWFNAETYRRIDTARMKFLFTDARSFMDQSGTQPTSTNDLSNPNANKTATRLGTVQREWLSNELSNNSKDFVFLMSEAGWTDAAQADDSWSTQGPFRSERNNLSNSFQNRFVGKMGIVSGGAHIPMVVGPDRFSSTWGQANTDRIIFETISGPSTQRFDNDYNSNYRTEPSAGGLSDGIVSYSNLGGFTSSDWVRSYGIITINEVTGNLSINIYNGETNTSLYPTYTVNVMSAESTAPDIDTSIVDWEELLGSGTTVAGEASGSVDNRKWWHTVLAIENQEGGLLKSLTTINPNNINDNISDFTISARYNRCSSTVPIPPAAFDNNDAYTPGAAFFAQGGAFIFRPTSTDLENIRIEINSVAEAENTDQRRVFKYYLFAAYNSNDETCTSLIPNAIDPKPFSVTTETVQSAIWSIPLMPTYVDIGCCRLEVDLPGNIDPYTGLIDGINDNSDPGQVRECTRFFFVSRRNSDRTYRLRSYDIELESITNRGEIIWQEDSSDIYIHDITWDTDDVLWALTDSGIRILTIGDSNNNSYALNYATLTTSSEPISGLFPIGQDNFESVGKPAMTFNVNSEKLLVHAKGRLWEFDKTGSNEWNLIKVGAVLTSEGVRDLAINPFNRAYCIFNSSLASMDITSGAGQGFGQPNVIQGSPNFTSLRGMDFVGTFGSDAEDIATMYGITLSGDILTIDEDNGSFELVGSDGTTDDIVGMASCLPGENLNIPPQPWSPGSAPWIFMIDASGSMEGARIDQLKEAFSIFVNNIVVPGEYLSVVVFGSPPALLSDGQPNEDLTSFGGVWGPFPIGGSESGAKTTQETIDIVNSISATGSTDFCAALQFVANQTVRFGNPTTESIIVFSDGDFTGSGCTPGSNAQAVIDNICNNIMPSINGAAGHSPGAQLQCVGIAPSFFGEQVLRGISAVGCGEGGYTLWIP